MDEKSLYAHILNLSTPWQVKFIFLMKMSVQLLSLLESLKIPG